MVLWLEGEAELLRVDVNHLAAGCLMEVYLQETTNIAMEIPNLIHFLLPAVIPFIVELLLCFGLIVGSMVRVLQNLHPVSSKLFRLENKGNERCKRPLSIMLGSLIFKEVFL
jgi:hypothetical protein